MSTTLALISHDLKNALGALESELAHLIDEPSPVLAQKAHLHCAELRREFVQFLTLYSAESNELRALCEDESPAELLASLHHNWRLKLLHEDSPLRIQIDTQVSAPPFWYFDRRLIQLALDAAIHNAMRFATSTITLSVGEVDHTLYWRVIDDGPGLGAADPGQQNATGLGTALAEAVGKAHQLGSRQGHVQLNPCPGGGTEFALCIP